MGGLLAFAGALIAAGCAGAAVNSAAPFGHGSWLAAYLVFAGGRLRSQESANLP
jgi:hypothetical protein